MKKDSVPGVRPEDGWDRLGEFLSLNQDKILAVVLVVAVVVSIALMVR